jgi:hypothetical protein
LPTSAFDNGSLKGIPGEISGLRAGSIDGWSANKKLAKAFDKFRIAQES